MNEEKKLAIEKFYEAKQEYEGKEKIFNEINIKYNRANKTLREAQNIGGKENEGEEITR